MNYFIRYQNKKCLIFEDSIKHYSTDEEDELELDEWPTRWFSIDSDYWIKATSQQSWMYGICHKSTW